MYEVEIKVRAPHEPVREALVTIGAEERANVLQADTYYDAPHRDFAATDEALRIRREWFGDAEPGDAEPPTDAVTARLAYKGPRVDANSKTREEFETRVADSEAMAAILSGVGFSPAATVRKARDRYAVEGYTVTLDDVDGLGEFVEVETEAPAGDVEAAREGAESLLSSIGLDPEGSIRTSYLGLLLADAVEE